MKKKALYFLYYVSAITLSGVVECQMQGLPELADGYKILLSMCSCVARNNQCENHREVRICVLTHPRIRYASSQKFFYIEGNKMPICGAEGHQGKRNCIAPCTLICTWIMFFHTQLVVVTACSIKNTRRISPSKSAP